MDKDAVIINKIRTGELKPGRILVSDPLALQKLKAYRECLKDEREFIKLANKEAKKNGKKQPYKPTRLANLTSKIAKITDRINNIESSLTVSHKNK